MSGFWSFLSGWRAGAAPAAVAPVEQYTTVELPTFGKLLIAAGGLVELSALVAPWQYRKLCESLAAGGLIDAALLQALATHESSNDPAVVSAPNANGTRDYGLFQINQENFTRYGLSAANVFDPEANGRAAVAELQRHEPHAKSRADLVSMYNAGEAAGGGPRRTGTAYVNESYVRAVLGWYLLFRVAEIAPVQKSGVPNA